MMLMIAPLIAALSLGTPQSAAKIVFVSDRDGNEEIYTMNADGSGQRRITNHPMKDVQPCWIENGRRIAWATNRSGDWEIFVCDLDGSAPENVSLTKERQDVWPMWAEVRSQLYYVSKSRLYRLNVDFVDPVMMVDYVFGANAQPSLHKDSVTVAFLGVDGRLLWMTGWHTTKALQIRAAGTHPGGKPWPSKWFNPTWSQDGTYLALDSGGPTSNLYFVEADGSDLTKVIFDGSGYDPSWMNASDTMVFTSNVGVGVGSDIYKVDLDAAARLKGVPKPDNLTRSNGNDREACVWEPSDDEG